MTKNMLASYASVLFERMNSFIILCIFLFFLKFNGFGYTDISYTWLIFTAIVGYLVGPFIRQFFSLN